MELSDGNVIRTDGLANKKSSLVEEYEEVIQLLELAVLEINKPNSDYCLLQHCMEKSCLVTSNLFYNETNEYRREFLQDNFKSVNFLNERIEEILSSATCEHQNEVDVANRINYCDMTADPYTSEDGISLSSLSKDLNSQSVELHQRSDRHYQARHQAIIATILTTKSITFQSVVGLEEAKKTLHEAIIMPLLYPHLFTGNRKPWTRILLYGPPGTGKSRLAHAVASEINSSFFSVSSSDLLSSWFGESEKMVRDLFRHARTIDGRSVVFMDEIDSLCRRRQSDEEEGVRRIKTELLRQMERQTDADDVFVLCATNCPWEIDSAFLRRFQKRVYIPLPKEDSRAEILKLHSGEDCDISEHDWTELGHLTEGYSGSDLAVLTNGALFQPVRELYSTTRWTNISKGKYRPCPQHSNADITCPFKDLPPTAVVTRSLSLSDFKTCLESNKATVNKEDLQRFETFTNLFGQVGS